MKIRPGIQARSAKNEAISEKTALSGFIGMADAIPFLPLSVSVPVFP